jgi:peptide deformylase
MIESMHYYQGVGIAANQVGSRHRICIIQRPEEDIEPLVLINPRVTRKSGYRRVTEGCLSLPGFQGKLWRSEQVWATAIGLNGERISFNAAEGLLAQVLEHETDHLNGVAYIDHLETPEDLYALEEQVE